MQFDISEEIIHHFTIQQRLEQPSLGTRNAGLDLADDTYRAEITFGSGLYSRQENFAPQLRGLSRPHLFLGERRDDIARTLTQTWDARNIEATSAGVGLTNGFVNGLLLGCRAMGVRVCIDATCVGLMMLRRNLPVIEPVAAPLASVALGLSEFIDSRALCYGFIGALVTGIRAGIQQSRSLQKAKNQDMLILNLIYLRNELDYQQSPSAAARHAAQQVIDQAAIDVESGNYPAASQALEEMLNYCEQFFLQKNR